MIRSTPGARRAFSLIELLVALTITVTLLAATMTALDTSFKSYKATTEGASTNVIARMVMHRMLAMIRTGENFGPYPADPLDPTQNPIEDSTFIEFETNRVVATNSWRVIRLEARATSDAARGPLELWYVRTDFSNGVEGDTEERPLLSGIERASFWLEYDVGPRLRRATVDLTVRPNDFQDASFNTGLVAPTIRLVSSVGPRKLED